MKTRELIADGLITLAHISTDLNVADFLTKPLTAQKFLEKRAYVMHGSPAPTCLKTHTPNRCVRGGPDR